MAGMITAKYRGALCEKTAKLEETINAASVRDVLAHIKTAYGKDAEKAAKSMLITVNGKSILRTGIFKTPLADGDVVNFLPISAGG